MPRWAFFCPYSHLMPCQEQFYCESPCPHTLGAIFQRPVVSRQITITSASRWPASTVPRLQSSPLAEVKSSSRLTRTPLPKSGSSTVAVSPTFEAIINPVTGPGGVSGWAGDPPKPHPPSSRAPKSARPDSASRAWPSGKCAESVCMAFLIMLLQSPRTAAAFSFPLAKIRGAVNAACR